MTEAEAIAIQLLKQIDQKLNRLVEKLSEESAGGTELSAKSRSERAREVAAMTPRSIRQTDTVELLHEDRLR